MCHALWRQINNRLSPATAGAKPGISTMHDELSSMKPGEAMSSAVVKAGVHSRAARPACPPARAGEALALLFMLTRSTMKKTEASRIAVNTEVTNRGPRIEG